MSSKNLYDKVLAIFGSVMVFFYFGLGFFIMFYPQLNIDKPLRIIFSIPLLVYGIYRILVSYEKIKESFFSNDDE